MAQVTLPFSTASSIQCTLHGVHSLHALCSNTFLWPPLSGCLHTISVCRCDCNDESLFYYQQFYLLPIYLLYIIVEYVPRSSNSKNYWSGRQLWVRWMGIFATKYLNKNQNRLQSTKKSKRKIRFDYATVFDRSSHQHPIRIQRQY